MDGWPVCFCLVVCLFECSCLDASEMDVSSNCTISWSDPVTILSSTAHFVSRSIVLGVGHARSRTDLPCAVG